MSNLFESTMLSTPHRSIQVIVLKPHRIPIIKLHYKTSYKSHKGLLLLFPLHPLLIPLSSVPVFFSYYRIRAYYPSEAEAGPALPWCKVEMLMLIKSFIWFRLISAALLLSRAVANQITPERRAEVGRWIRKKLALKSGCRLSAEEEENHFSCCFTTSVQFKSV